MQQGWWMNVGILALIALLLGVSVYEPDIEHPIHFTPLTNIVANEVHHIRLLREQQPNITLARQQGQWYVTQPFKLPANPFYVSKLLGILNTQQYTELNVDLNQLPFADLKLAPPLISMQINNILSVDFGDVAPLGEGQRYVHYNEGLYLVPDSLDYILTADSAAFASLFPIKETTELTLIQTPNYQLSKTGVTWKVDYDKTGKLSNNSKLVYDIVQQWQIMQALRIRSTLGTPTAIAAITLHTAEEIIQFDIIATHPSFILHRKDKGIDYQLPSHLVAQLLDIKQ